MRYILILFLITILIFSCRNKQTPHPRLLAIEACIDSDTEKATAMMESISFMELLDEFNINYYNLLHAEIDFKINTLTSENDSLLNIAAAFFRKEKHKGFKAKALFYRGRAWNSMGNDDYALTFYLPALNIFEQANNYTMLTKAYDDIGNLYMKQSLYNEAIEMFEKAYEIDLMQDNKRYMVLSLNNIGRAYLYLDPEKSKHYFDQACGISKLSKDSLELEGLVNHSYSVYYIEAKEYDKAIECLTKSDNIKGLFSRCLIKGEIFNIQEKYDSAITYLKVGIQSPNIYTKTASYKELYTSYQKTRQLEEAFECLINYQSGADSINMLTKNLEVSTLAYKYNIEKAVLEAKAQKDKQILILIMIFGTLFFIGAIIYIIKDKRIKLKEKVTEQEISNNQKKIEKREKEIGNLKHKILEYESSYAEYDNTLAAIKAKEENLISLLKTNTELQCKHFRSSQIFKRINGISAKLKSEQAKPLTYEEQDELHHQIEKSYANFTQYLKDIYPFLTNDDITLCCLSLLKLPPKTLTYCFTASNANATRQRKHRIKNKIAETSNDLFLYDFIFGKE